MECIICLFFFISCVQCICLSMLLKAVLLKCDPRLNITKAVLSCLQPFLFAIRYNVHGKTESLSTFWTLTQCSLVNLRYIYDALFCISYNTGEFQINRITYYTYVCQLHFSNICFRLECLCPGPRCNYSKSREWRFYQCYNF